MVSLFTDSDAGARRFAAATAAVAAFVAALFGLQGCASFSGSGADVDEYGWGDDGILPAANADADDTDENSSEDADDMDADVEASEASGAKAQLADTDSALAASANDDDIANLPNVIRAGDGDTGIFETEESAAAISKFNPIISKGYRLKVAVMVGDKNEVGPVEVMVTEREEITLPLVGRVPCGGLTIEALHSRLSGRYAEFFADPEVIVAFSYSDDGISPYGQVLVQGRVRREGWVNIPPTRNLRLSHAIQRCGGFSSSALRRKVLVTRRDDEGNTQRIIVDFKAIGKNGALEKDIILEPNDVVFVDESNF